MNVELFLKKRKDALHFSFPQPRKSMTIAATMKTFFEVTLSDKGGFIECSHTCKTAHCDESKESQ